MVDYYRCDVCGHVWSISKMHGTSRNVTAEVKNLKIA
jgi:rubredoxin